MAIREFASRLAIAGFRDARPRLSSAVCLTGHRNVSSSSSSSAPSSAAAAELADLEQSSSLSAPLPSEDVVKSFDPVKQTRERKEQLPASRYNFRPPKYYRGPFHPHQPPSPSAPESREFVPGPFSDPRLAQTYTSTIEPDLMTLTYQHLPPGFRPPPKAPRLRTWDGTSPYHKNRPARGPRGGAVLRLLKQHRTFRNVPELTGITVHTMVPKAQEDSGHLHVAGMILQAITNVRATAHKARHSVNTWDLREGRWVSLTCDLKGEEMHHFLGKCIDLVLPKIKDWRGVRGSTGDSSGNITFGLTSEAIAMFPEIEINYDMYPPQMIPGLHITIKTSATNDRDARLLLSAMGIPFYGKLVD
ncbi:ribosomal protein L5 [Xylona heveae TC161]|uniref:Large ribosomal subunit protein uL5m n=1 Tax=Xylona heveae (strain CBS 132557 / TC161) TaxID=1328760 RepID=A0A165GSG2_XYLHT|nr:ribosomal protein L5 [Xylona heveae TC161]KZF22537.1 ribosomal protein L5 [Xylona heveae TC161]